MSQQPPVPQTEEIHLQDYINVIIRRRWTFVASFLAVFAAVAVYTLRQPPLYESSATLFVKDDKGRVGQMGDLLLNSAAPVDSELEILKSRTNAEKVVAALRLNWKVERRSPAVSVKVLEMETALREPYTVQLLGGGRYLVKDSDKNSVGTGASGVLMRGRGLTLLLQDLKGGEGDSFRLTSKPFNSTVASLRKSIRVAEVGKKTNVISVTYRNSDPALAREVVNTLVQVYLDQGVAIKSEEATRTVGFLEEQLGGIRTELEGAEKDLEGYKSATGIVRLDTEAEKVIKTLTEIERRRAEVTLQRKQAQFALNAIRDARRSGSVYSPALLRNDPLVSSLAARLGELEVQKRGLLAEGTAEHPGVRLIQAQIEETQRKIQGTYESALKGIMGEEESVAREIARYEAQLKRLPVAERDLARLMRVAKVNADIYTFLLQKHEEARIAQASTISNIKVVDPAIAAEFPVAPNKRKNLMLGVIVGLMAAVGLCFFRDYLDDSLKDPEQVKRTLGLPLLAVIPFIQSKESNAGTICHDSPRSPASEAFRSLRTGLHFCSLKKQKKVTLVTSTFPGEGKSTVASNLAITMAQTGTKVLIVDCDLRRSSLHEKFGHQRSAGLSEVLAGDLPASAAIQESKMEGLHIMQAGPYPPNPAELLGSESMARFIEEMRQIYGHIIIDAPPVLAVTDAPLLTQLTDLVILVLEARRVPAKAALRTREMLAAAAAPVAGIVVSDKTARSAGYGYGYGYQREDEKNQKPWWRLK